jgi:hypothetical protein
MVGAPHCVCCEHSCGWTYPLIGMITCSPTYSPQLPSRTLKSDAVKMAVEVRVPSAFPVEVIWYIPRDLILVVAMSFAAGLSEGGAQ